MEAPTDTTGSGNAGTPLVDPRAPRFGQGVTATGLLAGIALGEPLLVYAIALLLSVAIVSQWRLDPYAVIWRRLLIPVVGKPAEREPAIPHRFAKLLGAVGSLLASVLLIAGFPIAGYAVAAAVGLAAGFAAVTGICLGCRMYRQVSFVRGHGVLG